MWGPSSARPVWRRAYERTGLKTLLAFVPFRQGAPDGEGKDLDGFGPRVPGAADE